MKTFLVPTKSKVIILLMLIVYVALSAIFTASISNSRIKAGAVQSASESVALAMTTPAMYLYLPLDYIYKNFYTEHVTTREIMLESGMVDTESSQTDPLLNTSINNSTTAGLIIGLVVELLYLYILSCFIAQLTPRKK